MAARPRALDVVEQQVALDFPEDALYFWHSRILLRRLGDGSRWIGVSPDLELEVVDLSDHRVVPYVRAAPLPGRVAEGVYHFDAADVTEDVLQRLHQEAIALAHVLGATVAVAGQAEWYFADTASEKFGEKVEVATLHGASAVLRGSRGLVEADFGDGPEWQFVEKVLAGDLDAWMDEKRSGPGRDPRVLSVEKDDHGHRYRSVRSAYSAMTGFGSSKPVDWPWRGPSASSEVFGGIRSSGHEIGAYHDFYLSSSGLGPDHPVAHKHNDMCAVLHHLTSYDQLNGLQSSGIECLCRLMLQTHAAVKRNCKVPDYKGTSLMVQSSLSSGKTLMVGEFAKWTAEEQKSEAFTMKQHRLYAEEEETRDRHRQRPPGNPKGQKGETPKKDAKE